VFKIKWLRMFLAYVLNPLFGGFRWFFWLIPFLWLGDSYVAMQMEIPPIDRLIKVRGKFIDTSKGKYSKTGDFSVAVLDAAGVRHSCDCSASGWVNCLSLKRSENKKMLKALDKKNGEIWMYPHGTFYGNGYACYQISDEASIYRSYEKSVAEYSDAKHGIGVYTIWFLLVIMFGSIVVRIVMFTTRNTDV